METALEKLSKADQWLAEAKTLEDLRQIHDIAAAAEAYAKAHRLGLSAENHAMEVRLLAARRIGELVPAEQGKRTDIKTSPKIGEVIPHQRLSEFRKLAKIPASKFKEKIETLKQNEERVTYNKILQPSPNRERKVDIRTKDIHSDSENLLRLKMAWNRATEKERKRFILWLKKERPGEFPIKL
jgi:hypothetical protein